MSIIFEIGIIIVGLGFIKWILFTLSAFISQKIPSQNAKTNFISKIISYYLICSLIAIHLYKKHGKANSGQTQITHFSLSILAKYPSPE